MTGVAIFTFRAVVSARKSLENQTGYKKISQLSFFLYCGYNLLPRTFGGRISKKKEEKFLSNPRSNIRDRYGLLWLDHYFFV